MIKTYYTKAQAIDLDKGKQVYTIETVNNMNFKVEITEELHIDNLQILDAIKNTIADMHANRKAKK